MTAESAGVYDMRDFEQSIIINEKIKLEERFEFRTIFSEEAVQAASVERVCFPPNEACTEEMMKQRALKIRELFFVAVDRKSGEVAGFLNGLATDIRTDAAVFRDTKAAGEMCVDPDMS